jgi:hypothetical protein
LSSLQVLDLQSNPVASLDADAFSGLSSLATLALYPNAIARIASGAFRGLSSLPTLDLSEQKLTAIAAGASFAASGRYRRSICTPTRSLRSMLTRSMGCRRRRR